MHLISLLIKFMSYMVFLSIGIYGILGIYHIVTNFGNGTSMLIAPTVFIIILSIVGIISTHHDVK